MALDAELDHHINQQVEELLDVRTRKLLPAAALLDQQHELLEGELRARRVHARDRARVPGVHVPEVIERLLRPQLGEQDPVGSHAQARLEQLLRRHASEALVILAVEEPDVVRVTVEDELARILDRDQPLLARDLPDQRLGPGGLAGSGGAGDQDVPAAHHREAHEGLVGLRLEEPHQLGLRGIEGFGGPARRAEDPAPGELVDRPDLVRGATDAEGHRAGGGRGRQHHLDALARGERCGKERRLLIDTLARRVGDELREVPAPVEARKRDRLATPALTRLKVRDPRLVDAELGHIGSGEVRPHRPQGELERGRRARGHEISGQRP